MVDYRKLRLNNLCTDYRHLFWLLFWPVFGLLFGLAERNFFHQNYHVMWCPLDGKIPFCEWFFIPYLFWFVFLVGMHVYLLLFDVKAFQRFMKFLLITYGVAMLVYIVYPTSQHLRPAAFPRDNLLTRLLGMFYQFDTSTNVCPSLHVVGSMAVAFAALDTPRFQKRGWKIAFVGTALLISVSTVFVKQHSAMDVFWAGVLCAIAYFLVYALPGLSVQSQSGGVTSQN